LIKIIWVVIMTADIRLNRATLGHHVVMVIKFTLFQAKICGVGREHSLIAFDTIKASLTQATAQLVFF
jgi:hypothetical protein